MEEREGSITKEKRSHIIQINEGRFSYDRESFLFESLNLEVFQGESIVIVGPSGHGKSTLIKLMSSLLELGHGEIHLFGENLAQLKLRRKKEVLKNIGILFQKNALFDSLTCFENVDFPLKEVTDLNKKERQRKVEEFLHAVDLGHVHSLYPSEISGGMQKRLGIARAMALGPDLTFYDNPTAGLDPITSRKIIELIKSVKASNQTIVTVINDMNRAYQLADRIWFVVDGEVIFLNSVKEAQECSDLRVRQFIEGNIYGPLTEEKP